VKKLFYIFIFIVMLTPKTFSQQQLGYVEVSGTVKDGIKLLYNANIEVYANNTLLKISQTDITGSFTFILELNRQYKIKFTKEFYASKFIEFNTNVRENELGIWLFTFTVELFPEIPSIDFSFLENEPIGKINYNKRYGEFEHDIPYTEKMHNKIKAALENFNSKRSNMYESIVRKADAYYKNGKSIEAINLYRQASILDRSNDYPQDQIRKIDKYLKDNLKDYDQYISLLTNADSLYTNHNFSQARFHYTLANEIVKGSAYAKYMIDKINKLLPVFNPSYINLQKYREYLAKGDQMVSEVKYDEAINYYNQALAIQPGDTYALKQINFLKGQLAKKKSKKQKQKKYQEFINLGDRYFSNQSYSAARLVYLKALQLKPDEKYPTVQINKIDQILYPNKARQVEEEFPSFTEVERNEAFLSELAKKYPQGKTIEFYDLPGKKMKRVILVDGKLAAEYLEVRYDYATFFFRNGQNISRAIFISETKE
jgi:tetratricopeptide (TPR) repeat protein